MLLAAGQSRRLGALAGHLPKPMLTVGGRPLMEHTVRRLARAGVTDVMVNLHHLGEAIQDRISATDRISACGSTIRTNRNCWERPAASDSAVSSSRTLRSWSSTATT